MELVSWNELRLRKQLCDGVIKTADGSSFPIHRVIVSSFSPYFRVYFTNSLHEGQPEYTEMNLPDVPAYIVSMIVEFAYTHRCQVTTDNVYSLMVAADKLSCDSLVSYCGEFITPHISAANCVRIFKFSQNYFFQDLEVKAWHMTCQLVEQAMYTSDFQSLTADELTSLLSDDHLNARREETVFEAVARWVLEDPDSRCLSLAKLLPCVRFGFITPDYYSHVIKRFPYFTQESRDFLRTVDFLFDKSEDSYYYRICNFRPRVPDEVVFTFGGWCEGRPTDAIETYDKRSDCWYMANIKDLRVRAYHGVVALNNMIYVIGGFDGVVHFNTVHCYDPANFTWTEKACMHDNRCYVSVCVMDGQIYAMGGFNGRTRLNSAERYDPVLNQWTLIAPMNMMRSDANAAALSDKVYVAGGFNGMEVLQSVERYCPISNCWEYVDPMRSPRSGVGIIAHENYIYALGGFDGLDRLKTVERFNPRYNRWDMMADMYCRRSNMATVIMDSSIFVIGGFSGNVTIRFAEVYDAEHNAWLETTPMNLNRSALAACVCRNLPNARSYTHLGVAGESSPVMAYGTKMTD